MNTFDDTQNDTPIKVLLSAAGRKDWKKVDEILPDICDDPETLRWSVDEGINAVDGDLRDLALSVLEISSYELKESEKAKLNELLLVDDSPTVRYRAAFALFNRDDRSSNVIAKIREALNDEAVREIAEGYLSQL